MSRPPIKWHSVFTAALDRNSAIAVQAAVAERLCRQPTRSEIIAARRAAHSFAAAGRGRVEHVRATGPGNRERLVLVRNDVELAAEELVAAVGLAAETTRTPDERRLHTQAAFQVADVVVESAARARHVQTNQIIASDRAALRAALRPALDALRAFSRELKATPAVK